MQEPFVAILFAISAAACFGGQYLMTIRSFAYVDPQTSSMYTLGICVIIFWLLAPFTVKAAYFGNVGMWIFLANGLIFPVFSIYLAFEASKRMGPTVSATIAATSPLFATVIAVLVLNESITVVFLMGTIATVAGIMILSWKRETRYHWPLWTIVFPLGAAGIRAVSQNIIKFGFQFLPSPYFASLMTFTVSFCGAVLIYRLRVGSLWMRPPLKCLMWNGLAGICIVGGVLNMYSALHYGRVIVVAPIIATFPFFTLLISLLVREERFKLSILAGMILIVGGIVWISSHQ